MEPARIQIADHDILHHRDHVYASATIQIRIATPVRADMSLQDLKHAYLQAAHHALVTQDPRFISLSVDAPPELQIVHSNDRSAA